MKVTVNAMDLSVVLVAAKSMADTLTKSYELFIEDGKAERAARCATLVGTILASVAAVEPSLLAELDRDLEKN